MGEIAAKGFALPVPIFKPGEKIPTLDIGSSPLSFSSRSSAGSPRGAGLALRNSFTSRTSFSAGAGPGGGTGTTAIQSLLLLSSRSYDSFAPTTMEDAHACLTLFGRQMEENMIHFFVLQSLLLPDKTAFRYDHPCKVVVITAASGLGKTALLENFEKRVSSLSFSKNIMHFSLTCTELMSNEPYKCWKVMIRDMLACLCTKFNPLPMAVVGGDNEQQCAMSEYDRKKMRWQYGMDYVISQLSIEQRKQVEDFLPLLCIVKIIPPIGLSYSCPYMSNAKCDRLSSADKLQKIGDILQEIMTVFTLKVQCLSILFIDDVHYMDAYSFKFLIRLIKREPLQQGHCFLLTWSSSTQRKSSAQLTPSPSMLDLSTASANATNTAATNGSPNAQLLEELTQSCNQLLKLTLGTLSFDSLKEMTFSLLSQEGIILTESAREIIYRQIEEITKGNPLFLYELLKAIVDTYKKSTIMHTQGSSASEDQSNHEELLHSILHSLKVHRIEEIIFYRFDRLDTRSQMLLKMGAVACATGSGYGFSLDMLACMLKSNHTILGVFLENDSSRNGGGVNYDSTRSSHRLNGGGTAGSAEAEDGSFFRDSNEESCREHETKYYKQLALEVKQILDTGEFLEVMKNSNRIHSLQNNVKSFRGNGEEKHDMQQQQQQYGESRQQVTIGAATQAARSPLSRIQTSLTSLFIGHPSSPSTPVALDTANSTTLVATQPQQPRKSPEDLLLEKMENQSFTFRVGLERSIIYELMVEEQKESLHDRVASFLEQENQRREEQGILSANELLEEAYHWEHGKVWSQAIIAYYQAGEKLEAIGAAEACYQVYSSCYRMYSQLRDEIDKNDTDSARGGCSSNATSSVIRTLDTDAYLELVQVNMKMIKEVKRLVRSQEEIAEDTAAAHATAVSALLGNDDASVASSAAPAAFTLQKKRMKEFRQRKKAVYAMFFGDEDVLSTTIQMLVKLARAHFTLDESASIAQSLYEEALQLISLTFSGPTMSYGGDGVGLLNKKSKKNGSRSSSVAAAARRRSQQMGSSSSVSAAAEEEDMTGDDIDDQSSAKPSFSPAVNYFGMKDNQVAFSILSGLSTLYYTQKIPDDEYHTKEKVVYDLMLALADTSPKYALHEIQAMCLKRIYHISILQYTEALQLADRIKASYEMERFSQELVKTYGNDRVPFSLAVNVQLLLCQGELEKAVAWSHDLQYQILPKIFHLHSMGVLLMPFHNCLLMLDQPQAAYECFSYYYEYEQSKGSEVFSFFRETNVLFLERCRLHAMRRKRLDKEESEAKPADASNTQLTELQKKILAKPACYLATSPSSPQVKPSLLFEALASFGVSVEMICADILYLLALEKLEMIEKQLKYNRSASFNVSLQTATTSPPLAVVALKEAEELAETAMSYLQISINYSCLPHYQQRRLFNVITCYTLKAKLLILSYRVKLLQQDSETLQLEELEVRQEKFAQDLYQLITTIDQLGSKHAMIYLSGTAWMISSYIQQKFPGVINKDHLTIRQLSWNSSTTASSHTVKKQQDVLQLIEKSWHAAII